VTFAFPEPVFDELREWLNLEVETAGILLVRVGAEGSLRLARSLNPIPHHAYRERGPRRLEIASEGYVPFLKIARVEGSIACFVHSHPGGDPGPSHLDDDVDAQLRSLFANRTGQPEYISLIVGGTSSSPRLFARRFRVGSDQPETIQRFRVAGRHLQIFDRRAGDADPSLFDRQILAFGSAGQLVLQQLRVGVVGAGGTGSAVAEQVLRLGVGSIVLIDDDEVSATNLTRIHESRVEDVGEKKVVVAARLAANLGHPVDVDIVVGRVTDPSIAARLTSCDVIFGCTDDHAGRAVLSRIAYWYLVPVIDTGVVVDSADGVIRGVFERVTTAAPGAACLVCRHVVDPIRVRDEQLPPAEREARVAEGYAPELGERDPSVVPYTTGVASLAVSELISRLFHVGEPADELVLRVHDRKIGLRAGASEPGHYCANLKYWGRGDEDPFLGQTW
jgi:proteasome lid subunit RPN8/RPN11